VRAAGALSAALIGVVLIAEVQLTAQPLGVVFALLAAAFWAAYILLGKVVAVAAHPVESLAVGWVIAALVTAVPILPFAHWRAHTALDRIVLLTFALAILSSVIPYRLDQIVFRIVGRGSFALLLALLPAAAVLVGFVALRQVPTTTEIVGIGFVVLAVALNDRRERDRRRPDG
jgi:inner membrane transporter RhtA